MRHPILAFFLFLTTTAIGLVLTGCSKTPFEPDWKTYSSDEFGISIDAPHPITFHVNDLAQKNGSLTKRLTGSMDMPFKTEFFYRFFLAVFKHQKPELFPVQIFFSSEKRLDKNAKNYDSKKMVDYLLSSSKKAHQDKIFTNYKIECQPTTCSGRPATLISDSYDFYDKGKYTMTNKTSEIIVTKGKQSWIFHFSMIYSGTMGDPSNLEMTKDREIRSIKIEPKP